MPYVVEAAMIVKKENYMLRLINVLKLIILESNIFSFGLLQASPNPNFGMLYKFTSPPACTALRLI